MRNVTVVLGALLLSCGGGGQSSNNGGGAVAAANASATPTAKAVHPCGEADKTHAYDLHDPDGDDALVPCSKNGKNDYSGAIHIETIPDGVHITINATDDQVDTGALGSDVKQRDAVIVYPKGPGSKAVEVPLMKTKDGYTGDRIITWDELGKFTDEGTKIDVAIFDHDKGNEPSEEMHVSVGISAGKSCEKAFEETPDTMVMGKAQEKDLSADQLGAPIGGTVVTSCGLPNSSNADVCVTIKDAKALGVTVGVNPPNNKVAACIDKQVRYLHYPMSHRPNKINKHF